jgi:deoxyadenosine/deoxycytidine kinase/ribonuclease HI
MTNPILISIEGNIGSGKSTLYRELKEKYKNDPTVCFVPEPVDEWSSIVDSDNTPILSNLYKDTKKYAFRFQMMAYISRLALIRKYMNNPNIKVIISERCVQTDKYVFAQMLYDDKCIEHDEFMIYNKWFDEFLTDIKHAGIIYVKADPETCEHRVKVRSREGEIIPLDYLAKCHKYHESWIAGNSFADLFIIDANIDISKDENKSIQQNWISDASSFIESFISSDLSDIYLLKFDGACRGNPSNILGLGSIIYNNGETVAFHKEAMNVTYGTNNMAEYLALLNGIQLALKRNIKKLIVEGDSELVIKQLNGIYKVKAENLKSYYDVIIKLKDDFEYIEFRHIKREQNVDADKLANQALDEKMK